MVNLNPQAIISAALSIEAQQYSGIAQFQPLAAEAAAGQASEETVVPTIPGWAVALLEQLLLGSHYSNHRPMNTCIFIMPTRANLQFT